MSAPAKTAGSAESKAPVARLSRAHAPLLQRDCSCAPGKPQCDSCEKKEKEKPLQRSAAGPNGPVSAPPSVARTLVSPGRSLDASTRAFMEPRFGRDFSGVRVHSDSASAESARAVNANAYTVGQHIVFDDGKYNPSSHAGKRLLAHELAHTVQQQGLQRSANEAVLSENSEYHRLEHEADSAARAILGPSSAATPVTLSHHPSRPVISRADKRTAQEIAAEEADKKTAGSSTLEKDSERKWKNVSNDPVLSAAGVEEISIPQSKDIRSEILVVKMKGPLPLPAEKGKKSVAEALWSQRAKGNALEALVDVSGEVQESPRLALKQGRPDTKSLRQIWLSKVGWDPTAADDNWKAARALAGQPAGEKEGFDPPQAGKPPKTCHVDHVVELQFGGTNIPENMQMLDGDENVKSGRMIFQALKDQAAKIRKAIPDAQNVIIHYDSVVQEGEICGKCCQVEAVAPGVKGGKAEIAGEKYEVKAGGSSTNLILPATPKADKPTPIRDQPAATIIPGVLLDKFHHKGGPGKDKIDAIMDVKAQTGTKTKLPVTLADEKPFALAVTTDRVLKLLDKRPNIKFHYDYLSDGVIKELNLEEDGSVSGKGEIKPSIPFLPLLHVKFDKDSFALVAPLDAKKLKPPIPGAKITEGEIGLELAPQFKPYGALGFELATGAKKILDGRLEVTGDARGLVATGKLHAFLPGIDNAEGDIKYQNSEWTGGVKIEANQLQSKLKYVKSGSATVGFSKAGISAAGKVLLDIPGTKGVEAELLYESNKRRWVFRGKGSFEPPRLKPVEIELEYDGDHLTGEASTGFEFHGIGGNIRVRYRDEKFSGEGRLEIHKGKANGFLHVVMHPFTDTPKFSGEGELSYQLTENLIAKAGISIDEQEKVRLKGALEFPKPIELFKPLKGDYKIFEIGVSIPIPGASIGPVGLKARIDGALSAGYQLGPGELRNTKLEAAFNPLEEKPDLDVVMTSTLFIGASAHITGKISGSIVVDAVIASVSGGLTISATASLDGHVASEVRLHYQQSRFELDAKFELLVGLAIILALDAFVKARAGIGPFSVEKEKVWNLASFKFDTGLQFGFKLKKPLHYASDQPVQLPSLDDLEWTVPKLDAGDILKHAFGGAGSKESEKGS